MAVDYGTLVQALSIASVPSHMYMLMSALPQFVPFDHGRALCVRVERPRSHADLEGTMPPPHHACLTESSSNNRVQLQSTRVCASWPSDSINPTLDLY